MIPALLSCLYVIYLYRTLNCTPTEPKSEVTSESLSDRISRIQSRIDLLAKEAES